MGVSVSPSGQRSTYWDQIAAIASDPKGFSDHMAKLTAEIQKNEELVKENLALARRQERAVGGKAKLDDLDAYIAGKEAEAKGLIAQAQDKSAAILDEHKTKMSRENTSLAGRRRVVKAREDAVEKKEQEIDPLFTAAKEEFEKAQKAEKEAVRTKLSYEGKMQRLKAAIKEAGL